MTPTINTQNSSRAATRHSARLHVIFTAEVNKKHNTKNRRLVVTTKQRDYKSVCRDHTKAASSSLWHCDLARQSSSACATALRKSALELCQLVKQTKCTIKKQNKIGCRRNHRQSYLSGKRLMISRGVMQQPQRLHSVVPAQV